MKTLKRIGKQIGNFLTDIHKNIHRLIFFIAYVGSAVLTMTSLYFITKENGWVFICWIGLIILLWVIIFFPVKYENNYDEDPTELEEL